MSIVAQGLGIAGYGTGGGTYDGVTTTVADADKTVSLDTDEHVAVLATDTIQVEIDE